MRFHHEDYVLTGVVAGTPIWLAMEADFDAWLELLNGETLEVLAWDDDSGRGFDALLGFLPQDGITYVVRASSYGEGSTGAYALRTLALPDAELAWTAAAAESTAGNNSMVIGGGSSSAVSSSASTITMINVDQLVSLVMLSPDVYQIENRGNTILWHGENGQACVEVAGQRQQVTSPWPLGAGDASTLWRMLAAETLDGVNTILWRHNPSNGLHLWTLDANWHWQTSSGLIPLGTDEAWELESRFQIDGDGDGQIGAPPPVVTLSVGSAAVAEDGAASLVYTFSRTGSTARPLQVNVQLGGTATPFSDYSGISATGAIGGVTFAAGSTTATLTLTPVADTRIEANETIAVTLVPGQGYLVGTSAAVVGTLLNDDSQINLYPASGSLPSAQGWLAFGTGFTGRQSLTSRGTVLDSTLLLADIAGYSNRGNPDPALINSAFPALDRGVGFGLDVTLRLESETHLSDNRAGFSLLLLDQGASPVGIELGFWTNRIFSQAGGATPFTAIAEAVEGIDTRLTTTYSLRVFDETYILLANNRLILQGRVQEYSQASVPSILPYNPYTTANTLFLGDNTSRASARVELGPLSLNMPLSGGNGNDAMTGTAGPDQRNGMEGDDVLSAGAGDDWLIGGAGDDTLMGGEGQDVLTGGQGMDHFVTTAFSDSLLAAPDIITDYSAGDVLDRPGPGTLLEASIGSVASLTASLLTNLLTPATFPANSTVAFTVTGQPGTFVAFDAGTAGFDASVDSVVHLANHTIISATNTIVVI
ncbi:MAG: bluetail domain-containing putative surface protein [Cyanobacteriota bacterium]|nr:bluetail domain-containing putative surface protein [Cyanobacteriota bacterium]